VKKTLLTGITVAALTVLGSLQDVQASGAANHPTCQQTSTRVLKPFLGRLASAQKALGEYEAKLSEHTRKIRQFMVLLRQSKARFDEVRDKDLESRDIKIQHMLDAIDDIRRKTMAQIAELRQKAAEARAKNRMKDAEILLASAQRLSQKLSAGEVVGYKKEIGWSTTINKWRQQANTDKALRNKRAADWAAGEIKVFLKFLGYPDSWSGIQKQLLNQAKKLATASRREPKFFLTPLGYPLNGKGIDDYLAKKIEELELARSKISAGKYKLFIPVFGYPGDRNYAQSIMDKANAKRARDQAAWGTGTYKSFSKALGYPVTNGYIQTTIEKKQTALAAFIAAGNKAKTFVPELGYPTTGEAILGSLNKAKKPKGKTYWNQHYGNWRRAIEKAIEGKKADINNWQKNLIEFKAQWRQDLKNQQTIMDTRLTWALGETPCGGSSDQSDAQQVAWQRGILGAMSETPEEKRCRLGRYGDNIFISKAGDRFGDVREAFLAAISDTSVKDPSANPKSLSDTLLDYKNMLDYLTGSVESILNAKQLVVLNASRQKVQEIISRLNKLPKGLQRSRAKVFKTFLRDTEQLLKSGAIMSQSQLSSIAATLANDKLGKLGKTKDVRRIARALKTLANTGVQLNGLHLPRLASISSALARTGTANVNAARSMLTQNVGSMGKSYRSLSGLDRALFVISVANAGAEMTSMMNSGKSAREAGFRAATNLTIDFVLGGIPLAAAAEAATQIAFNSAALASGDQAWSDATLSNITKGVAQWSLDKIGNVSAFAGSQYASLIDNASGSADLAANVNREQLTGALVRVQAQLNALSAGDPKAARLMRIRARLRQLLRVQDGLNCDKILAANKV